jgi:hypothetical protein
LTYHTHASARPANPPATRWVINGILCFSGLPAVGVGVGVGVGMLLGAAVVVLDICVLVGLASDDYLITW